MLVHRRSTSWGAAIACVLGMGLACTAEPDDNTTLVSSETASATMTADAGTETEDPTTDPSASATSNTTTSNTTSETETSVDDSSSGVSTTGEPGAARVAFETTLGTIVIELDELAAPVTSANFLAYVDGGFYDGNDGNGATIFHRVIPGFVVQGGGLTEALQTKATLPAIVNEFGNGLLNIRGSISMARTMDPDSATSQFFLNLVDNVDLDIPPGYAVFGQIVEGLEVMDAMATVETMSTPGSDEPPVPPYDDVPVEPIVVLSATRL